MYTPNFRFACGGSFFNPIFTTQDLARLQAFSFSFSCYPDVVIHSAMLTPRVFDVQCTRWLQRDKRNQDRHPGIIACHRSKLRNVDVRNTILLQRSSTALLFKPSSHRARVCFSTETTVSDKRVIRICSKTNYTLKSVGFSTF